jgi:hypothetical protein
MLLHLINHYGVASVSDILVRGNERMDHIQGIDKDRIGVPLQIVKSGSTCNQASEDINICRSCLIHLLGDTCELSGGYISKGNVATTFRMYPELMDKVTAAYTDGVGRAFNSTDTGSTAGFINGTEEQHDEVEDRVAMIGGEAGSRDLGPLREFGELGGRNDKGGG